jgi:dihydrofolate synthase/folylpolyglutamate synthase
MYHFKNIVAAEAALEQFLPAKIQRPAYTTEHIQAFLAYVDNPQDSCPAIHIAGTSGKTSTAYYAAALLHSTGKRVGLLTSPHIDTITERVQINGRPLPEQTFCDELASFMDLVTESGERLTYAELLYAFAFWEFSRHHVDYMIIETGMGGLLDATNVMNRRDKVCVLTDIGVDHTNVLGTTLTEITEHKAGIITTENTVLLYKQPKILPVIDAVCRRNHADLHIIDQQAITEAYDLPLFQQRNFGLALAAVNYVVERDNLSKLTSPALRKAAHTAIIGRMEILSHGHQTIILDGAHNPQKLRTLRESIIQQYPNQPAAILVSFIKSGGRDIHSLLKELEPHYAHIIATSPKDATDHQWYTPEEIATAAKKVGITSLEAASSYEQAVKIFLKRPETVLVITGSLYAHQYVRPLLQPLSKK